MMMQTLKAQCVCMMLSISFKMKANENGIRNCKSQYDLIEVNRKPHVVKWQLDNDMKLNA